jgi:hypothetical protein
MCFNGVKSWLLGWYSDRHKTFDPLTGGNLVGTKMAALDDYLTGKTTTEHSVVLKIVTDSTEADDYYVMYNRAKGVNAEVRRYANEVTITKGRAGAASTMVGHLASGQVHTLQVSGKSMAVKLCRFDTESTGAEYAMINVYDASLAAPSCPAPAPAPVPAPVPVPVPVPVPAPVPAPVPVPVPAPLPVPVPAPIPVPVPVPVPAPVPAPVPVTCASRTPFGKTLCLQAGCRWNKGKCV